MSNKTRKILELCKLLFKAIIVAIRVKILDVRCLIEERKDDDLFKLFNAKLTTLYVMQLDLCDEGHELCVKGMSICNELKEGAS